MDTFEIAHYITSDKANLTTVIEIKFNDGKLMKFTTKSLELFIHALQSVLEQAEDRHSSLRIGPSLGTDTKVQVR